jgi:pilus assembly protein Flp/PilA
MFLYLFTLVQCLKSDRKGVTALEYGLLAGLIAIVASVGATTLGTSLSGKFTVLAGSL